MTLHGRLWASAVLGRAAAGFVASGSVATAVARPSASVAVGA